MTIYRNDQIDQKLAIQKTGLHVVHLANRFCGNRRNDEIFQTNL